MAGELLDVFFYERARAHTYLIESQLVQATNPYLGYLELYEEIRQRSLQGATCLLERADKVNQQLVVVYSEVRNFVSMVIKLAQEKHDQILAYVKKTYSNVKIYSLNGWMRLDFNKDGKVDLDDLRLSLGKFYEFLKSYDYI